MSLRYCEQGVLENMHIAQYFKILNENPTLDFSKKLGDNVIFFFIHKKRLLSQNLKI